MVTAGRIRIALWGLIGLTCLAYAPLAFEYMWHYFTRGAPRLQETTIGALVSREFAFGAGSVSHYRGSDYTQHRWAMLVHTTFGAVALVLAPMQFSNRLRISRPKLHRTLGKATLLIVTVSMTAGVVYLLGVSPIGRVGGLGFYLQLWMLAGGTQASAVMGLWAIRRRDVARHRAWMAMMLALLMTAPTLRGFWVVFGNLWPGADLVTTLGVGVILLGFGAASGGIVASRVLDATGPRAVSTVIWAPTRRDTVIAMVLGAAVAGSLIAAGAPMITTPYGLPTLVVMLGVVGVMVLVYFAIAGHHENRGDSRRAELWRLHTFAVATIPLFVVAGWLAISPFVPTSDAAVTSAMVAAPLPIGLAFIVDVMTSTKARRTALTRRTIPVPTAR